MPAVLKTGLFIVLETCSGKWTAVQGAYYICPRGRRADDSCRQNGRSVRAGFELFVNCIRILNADRAAFMYVSEKPRSKCGEANIYTEGLKRPVQACRKYPAAAD